VWGLDRVDKVDLFLIVESSVTRTQEISHWYKDQRGGGEKCFQPVDGGRLRVTDHPGFSWTVL